MQKSIELHPKDRMPFHWIEKNKEKTVKFFMKDARRESSHFTLADCGSLAVTNVTETGDVHFFRVTKRLVLNSTFIVIEDLEHAPYKINNISSQVGLSFAQKGTEMEHCPDGEERPFAWRNVLDKSNFMLNARFYVQKSATEMDIEYISETSEYSMDILNRSYVVNLKDSQQQEYEVHIAVYTNEF